MTFRNRALGILAGAALALGFTAGAMAEDATVTLKNNPADGAGCSVSLVNAAFDLGVWYWIGTEYAYEAGSGNVGGFQYNVTQNLSSQPINCIVSVSGGPLTQVTDGSGNPVTNGATINMAFFLGFSANQTTVVTPPGSGASGGIQIEMGLQAQPAGVYEGTVTVTASESS